MINVFTAAYRLTKIVNPTINAIYRASEGTITQPDGSPSPRYVDQIVEIEVQAIESGDLELIENITKQSDLRAIYIAGGVKALNRPLQIGGDKFIFYGSTWNVIKSLEEWGDSDWSKVIVARVIK